MILLDMGPQALGELLTVAITTLILSVALPLILLIVGFARSVNNKPATKLFIAAAVSFIIGAGYCYSFMN